MMQSKTLNVTTVRGRSSATFSLDVAVTELPDLVTRAVASSRRFTLQSIQPDHAIISVGINWAAWGGHLEVRITPVRDTRSNIEATWVPVVSTTLVDWGQGARDIRALVAALNQNAAGGSIHG